ncbi:MAG: hypothetical protein PHE33_11355 [Bacteroidales bacterium]|nr:hypothetical protein [Bacteroidales bacterium]
MKYLFEYLFYRLYTWNLKKWGENDNPQLNAILGVSFIMFLNICSIIYLLDLVFDMKLVSRVEIPIFVTISASTILLMLNYFRFLWKSKFKVIVRKYKNEDCKLRRRKLLFLWLYVLISFLGLIFIAYGDGKGWW